MDPDFWHKRWEQQQIGFHEGRPNRWLERFGEQLGGPGQARVLVPLCGKSHDLLWLRDRGFRVTGVELVRQAAVAFFEENGLEARVISGPGSARISADGVEIAIADFLQFTDGGAPFDAAYDRAALIAVAPSERERYVEHLLSLLKPGARVLLISFAYDQERLSGPPFSLTEDEIRALFGARCELSCLADEDILESEPRFKERGLDWLREQIWSITKR